jgi:hypothetical protein
VAKLIVVAVMLAGCATSINKLSKTEIEALNIASVDIRFAPDAHIWWGTAEREYAAKVGAAPPEPKKTHNAALPGDRDGDAYRELMDSPAAKKYLQDRLSRMIHDRLDYFVHKYEGSRPVRLEVEVKSFVIPSPLQRLTLGGAPLLATEVILRDVATGQELGKLDRVAVGQAGGGIAGVVIDQVGDDLEDRVLDKYYSNVRSWLAGE